MRSKLSDTAIIKLYSDGERINTISAEAGISRQAVRDCLIRNNVYDPLHGSLEKKCLFCGETFRVFRGRVKNNGGNFCSIICFHASRSLSGEYSRIGGAVTRVNKIIGNVQEVSPRQQGRQARKAIIDSGIQLNKGEVIHHKDGNKSNNSLDNLQVFESQSAHMQFHHSLRGNKVMADFIKKQGRK